MATVLSESGFAGSSGVLLVGVAAVVVVVELGTAAEEVAPRSHGFGGDPVDMA